MKMGKMNGALIPGFRMFSLGGRKLTYYSVDSTLTDMRKVSFRCS